jgi:hypothetical protein
MPLCCMHTMAAITPARVINLANYSHLLQQLLALACHAHTKSEPLRSHNGMEEPNRNLMLTATSTLCTLSLHSREARTSVLEHLLPWSLANRQLSEACWHTFAAHCQDLLCTAVPAEGLIRTESSASLHSGMRLPALLQALMGSMKTPDRHAGPRRTYEEDLGQARRLRRTMEACVAAL